MGEAISRHKPADVPWEVLIAELSELYQDELCETAVVPHLHEHELCDKIEISLTNKLFQRCKKRREHKHFIEYKDLKMADLPVSGRCPGGFDEVKNIASRTVRMLVNYTSPDRPERWRIALKDLNKRRYGTGSVDDRICLSDDKFLIQTAAHVVFNEDELKKTWVNFFFDGDNASLGMIKAKGVSIEMFSEEFDVCKFICQVESPEVGRRVRARLFTSGPIDLPSGFKLAFCVSHPHGTTKKVTFGKLKSKGEEYMDITAPMFTKLRFMLKNLSGLQNISDESLLYFVMKNVVIPESDIIRVTQQYQPSLSAPGDFLLSKLTDQSLIKPPSLKEGAIFQKSLSIAKEEMHEKLRERCINIDRHLSKPEMDKQLKQIYNDFMSQQSLQLSKVWREKMTSVVRELYKALTVVVTGDQTLKNQATHPTIYYDIATCPGSSGARIVSKEVDATRNQVTVYIATHSMGHGGGTRGNRSGKATGWSYQLQ